jgi:hypothetical protein
MNIAKEAADLVAQQRPEEQQKRIEQLTHVFMHTHNLDPVDVGEGVQILLDAVLQVNPADTETKEAFLETIRSAVVFHDIEYRVNWDGLAAELPSLEKKPLLECALHLLGLSGQEKYVPVMEEYTHHSDPGVKKMSEFAITEITYRVAHHSLSAK